jgi:DnaJ-class molecular chaperone
MIAMKTLKSNEASTEIKCSACGGTGFPTVTQPAQAGRKIYPPACKLCAGKGRINAS